MSFVSIKGGNMKGKIVVGLFVCLLVISGTHFLRTSAAPPAPTGFLYESGAFTVAGGEFAGARIVNMDTVSHTYRVVIYRVSGATFASVGDTGVQSLGASGIANSISPVEPGALDEYVVEISTDSSNLIPSVIAQTPGCDLTCHVPRLEFHGAQLLQFKQTF